MPTCRDCNAQITWTKMMVGNRERNVPLGISGKPHDCPKRQSTPCDRCGIPIRFRIEKRRINNEEVDGYFAYNEGDGQPHKCVPKEKASSTTFNTTSTGVSDEEFNSLLGKVNRLENRLTQLENYHALNEGYRVG